MKTAANNVTWKTKRVKDRNTTLMSDTAATDMISQQSSSRAAQPGTKKQSVNSKVGGLNTDLDTFLKNSQGLHTVASIDSRIRCDSQVSQKLHPTLYQTDSSSEDEPRTHAKKE